jgi:hypothetical protein
MTATAIGLWERLGGLVLPLGVGVLAGILTLTLEGLETKWFVACFLLLLGIPVAIAGRHAYALHLVSLTMCLQLNVWLSFFLSSGGGYVGRSGPTALEIYLVTMVAAAAAVARLSALRAQGVPWRWAGALTRPAQLVLLTMLISFVNTAERRISLFSVIQFGQFYLIYLAALNTIRSRRELELVVHALLATVLTQAAVYFVENATGMTFTLTGEVVEKAGDLGRHGGTVSTHPSGFAEFMNPLFAIACAVFLGAQSRRFRTVAGLAVALGAASVLLTFTRAAWIGAALAGMVLLVAAVRRGLLRPNRLVVAALLGVIVTLPLLPKIALVFEREHESDYAERVSLQQMALNVIEAHPLVGTGIGTYSFTFRNYLSGDFEDEWLYVVHNAYLLRAAETGIPGMLAMIWLLWVMMRLARRCAATSDPLTAQLGLGAIAGFVAIAFQFWWDTATAFPVHALLWFLAATLEAALNLQEQST